MLLLLVCFQLSEHLMQALVIALPVCWMSAMNSYESFNVFIYNTGTLLIMYGMVPCIIRTWCDRRLNFCRILF